MTLRQVTYSSVLVLGTLLLSVGIQVGAQSFTPPPAEPPNSNAYAPLNTGPYDQIKSATGTAGQRGQLTVNGTLQVINQNAANLGIYLQNGRVQVGATPDGTSVSGTVGLALFGKKVRITDGTQGAGKVLTSDENGLASWQVPGGSGSGGGKCGSAQNCAEFPGGAVMQWGKISATSCNRTNGDGVASRLVTFPVAYSTPSSYNVSITPFGTSQSVASENCLPAGRSVGSPSGFNIVTDGNCDGVTFMWQTIGI